MIGLKKITTISLLCLAAATVIAAAPPLLNDPVDVSGEFRALENSYYLADQREDFNPAAHTGKIVYQRAQYRVRHAFDNDLSLITAVPPNEFPEKEYAANPALPFSIDFVSPRTLRIKMTSGPQVHPPQPELMLAGEVPHDGSWKYEKISGGHRYTRAAGSVTILEIWIKNKSSTNQCPTSHNLDE
jgi:alpha-D-xyloside xylohydrolase